MDLRKTGRLISKKRKALNLTLGQLSEKLGVTPQAVHLWESGKRVSRCIIADHDSQGAEPEPCRTDHRTGNVR